MSHIQNNKLSLISILLALYMSIIQIVKLETIKGLKYLKRKIEITKKKTFLTITMKQYISTFAVFIMVAVVFSNVIYSNVKAEFKGTPPPSQDDWLIGNETYAGNETIVVNGNVIINETGKLTLFNCTLKMNCTTVGEFMINIEKLGELNIINSTVKSYNSNYNYKFKVNGDLEIENSVIDNLWGDQGPLSGIELYSGNSKICNSTISNVNGTGIFLDNCSALIYNNYIYNCIWGIYCSNLEESLINTTADFDDGTKNNIETYSDWSNTISNSGGVPPDEFHLEYGDVFSDNFEGTNGQNLIVYDNNWQTYIDDGSSIIISNDQSYSGDLSIKFTQSSGGGSSVANRPIDWSTGTEELVYYWRCNPSSGRDMFSIRTIIDGVDVGAYLFFDIAQNILYFDGFDLIDSEENYTDETWYKIKIVHDPDGGTYDAFILGGNFTTETQICDDALYLSGGTGIPDSMTFQRDSIGYGEYWIDNIKVGDYQTTGDWESAEQEMNENYKFIGTTITHKDLSSNSKIKEIKWQTNGATKATYNNSGSGITSGISTTITNSDLDSGSFNDIDMNYTIEVYLEGDGIDTPKITQIENMVESKILNCIPSTIPIIKNNNITNCSTAIYSTNAALIANNNVIIDSDIGIYINNSNSIIIFNEIFNPVSSGIICKDSKILISDNVINYSSWELAYPNNANITYGIKCVNVSSIYPSIDLPSELSTLNKFSDDSVIKILNFAESENDTWNLSAKLSIPKGVMIKEIRFDLTSTSLKNSNVNLVLVNSDGESIGYVNNVSNLIDENPQTFSENSFARSLNSNVKQIGIDNTIISLNFSTNGTGSLTLSNLSIEWNIPNIFRNNISCFYYGLFLDNSTCLVSNNLISYNNLGVFLDDCKSSLFELNSFLNGNTDKTVFFEANDLNSLINLNLPKMATVTNASFKLKGCEYIPDENFRYTEYEYLGYIYKNSTDLQLNNTIDIDKPAINWDEVASWVIEENLSKDGEKINPSEVNLSAEHNEYLTNFNTSNPLHFALFNSSVPPGLGITLFYHISTNSTNVKGNFTTVVLVSDNYPTTWTNTTTGYTIKIPLNQPPKNLTNPLVKIELPALNFAQINVTVNETNQNLTQNITIIDYNITLDLNTIPEIGSIWGPTDPHRNLTINLTFYLDSPSLDVCDDGYIDWECEGNFVNNSIKIDQDNYNLAEVLNDYISDFGCGNEIITLNFSANSAGKINITNLSIEYYTNPTLAYNLILNNTKGIFLNHSSASNIFYNFVYGNEYGVYSKNCFKTQNSITSLSDSSKNKSVEIHGDSNESTKLMIPNGAVITAASFDITGSSFVPSANLTHGYEYCGNIKNNSVDLELNTTINLTNMDGWNTDNAYVKVGNLLYYNASVNVTDVNLTAEHNSFKKSFHNKTNYVFFYDFMTSDTKNPLQFNVTTNCTNVTADFEIKVDFYNYTEISWTSTSKGANVTIPLNAPEQNLSNPEIKIYLPNKNFAEIEIKIVESNQTISSEYINLNKISLGYIIVDLTNVTEIGSTWNLDDDENISMFVDLEYYLSSPSLDVGDNYNFEWQADDEFDNETVTINEDTYGLVRELNGLVSKINSGYSFIPITLNSISTGNITIDNISVTYITQNILCGNIIIENENGTYFKSSYGYLLNNNISDNDYDGINCTDSSDLYIINNFISDNYHGVKDNNNDLIISNNNITYNNYGLYLSSTDFDIDNNNMVLNNYGLLLKSSCTGTASDNLFLLNKFGIHLEDTSPTIKNTTFILNNYTIFCKGSSPIIRNSTIKNSIDFDINLTSNSHAIIYDSYLNPSEIITLGTSNLTVYRNLIVNVLDDGYDWIVNTTVNITYLANNNLIFSGATDSKGKITVKPYRIYFQNATGSDDNSTYEIEAEKVPLGKNKVNISLEMFTGIKEHLSFIASDTDNDGVNDGEELYLYRTNPKSNDTDADGLWDGVEIGLNYPTTNTTDIAVFIPDQDTNTTTSPVLSDTDSDGLTDGIEDSNYNGIINISETDPNDPDTDNDGILDGWELDWNVDTDGDGKINALDTDSDNDALPDGTEDVDRDGYISEGELSPLLADTDNDGWLDNNTNYLIELKLLNVTGCDTYSITVHGVRHPSSTTQFYNSSENINVVISTGFVQQNINMTLRDENNNTIARFLVSSNRSNNVTIYLIYNNISINISSRIFYYNVDIANDTDSDGISDLRELIYWSAYGANCTTVDTDQNGTVNIYDPDSDGDNLLDGEELSGTPVRSTSSDLNIYKANNNQLFNYTCQAGDLNANFKPYSANNTHSYISISNKIIKYFAASMSSNGTIISYNQNVTALINGSSIYYSNLYLNTTLIHRIESSGLSCTYNLTGLPQGVTENMTLGSVLYFNTSEIFLYVDGVKQTSSFTTNKTIEFRDSSGYLLWFIGKAVATDDNGNSVECIFNVTPGANQVNFNVILPYSYLNDPSTVYPVEVEYSSADTGETKGFKITTTADFDQGTKNNVKTYTDDSSIPLGQMQVGFLPDEDLILYYPLDEGTATLAYEETGNGNVISLYKPPTWTSGVSGYALEFDGIDDYGYATYDPNIVDIDSEFYVQAWIKAEESELTYQLIVEKYIHIGGNKAKGFTFYLSSGKLRLSIYSGDNGNGNVYGTSDLRDNTWHKVAGSWDGEYMRVYVDGALEGEVAWSHAPADNWFSRLEIGKRIFGHGDDMYFRGTLDEIRIYETEFQSSSGTWESATISDIPAGKQLVSTTIEHYIPDGSKISKIEWKVGSTVEAMYDNYGKGITSGSSTTITNLDLSSGYFSDINSQPFSIKVYMEGETDILAITEIRGSYALWGQPIADAGENQGVGLNEEVQLNSSGSYNPTSGGSLTYSWGKAKAPEDINFKPSSSVMSPSFTPSKKGLYKLRLVVNNEIMDSDPDHVYVAVNIPIAIINGQDDAIKGSTVQFDGSESFSPYGKIIAYSWSVRALDESAPYLYGSGSELSFKVNKLGNYVVQLSVKDIEGYHSPTEILYLNVIWPWSMAFLIDSDGDGLTDGDEKYKDGTHGDTDGYITNPSNTDTDGDGLWDGLNISEGGEVIHRGEQSVQVYEVTTNPTKPDSDGDEIQDNEEVITGSDGYITNPMSKDTDFDYIYDLEEMKPGNDGYITDPTDPDTDDDGGLDGLEVQGWPVYIYYGSSGEFKEKRSVNSNPTPGHKDDDGDGFLDGEEIAKQSDPDDFDTDDDYYEDVFDDDPCRIENELPYIVMTWDFEHNVFTVDITVKIKTHDQSGIIYIKSQVKSNTQDKVDPWYCYHESPYTIEYEHKFELNADGSGVYGGWDVIVEVCDYFDNIRTEKRELDSFTEFLAEKVAEWVEDVINTIKDWVLDVIKDRIIPIISGIKSISGDGGFGKILEENGFLMDILNGKRSTNDIIGIFGSIFSIILQILAIGSIIISVAFLMPLLFIFAEPFLLTTIISLDDIGDITLSATKNNTSSESNNGSNYEIFLWVFASVAFFMAGNGIRKIPPHGPLVGKILDGIGAIIMIVGVLKVSGKLNF